MRTNLMGRLQIGAYRKDGVVLVGVGDHQMVLLNIVEGWRTTPIDELAVNRYGPWVPCKPTAAARERVQRLLSSPGHLTTPETVGVQRDLPLLQLSRQDFIDLFTEANLEVGDTFPDQQTFQEEPDFLQNCLSTIVPQMQAAGIAVDDPSGFCALMHMERTGLMPYGSDQGEWGAQNPAPDPNAAPDPAMASAVPVRDPVAGAPLESAGGGPLVPQLAEIPPIAPPAAPVPPVAAVPPPIAAADPVMPPVDAAPVPGAGTIGKPFKKKSLDAIGKPAA
jgi:hypothetical protein